MKGNEMKTVKCIICGKVFMTERPNKKYCSFSCKEAGRMVKRKAWEEENPTYNAAYQQHLRDKAKERKQDQEKATN